MTQVGRNRDVVVVGAGVIGCSVAYELARRKVDVLVVDTRGVGQGATQASAGMLAPYHEARPGGALLALAVRSLGLYDRFMADVRADSGRAVPYARDGSLEVVTSAESAGRLRAAADELGASRVPCTLLDAPAVHAAEPLLAPDVSAGLIIPDHGHLAARDFTQATAAAATAHGAAFDAPRRVRQIAPEGAGLRVETDRSVVTARQVVLAAGSWSADVVADDQPPVPVRPVRGQLLHLAWNGPPIRRIVWGRRCYVVPLPDATVLVGATTEEVGFDERATVAGVHGLLDAVGEMIPGAREAAFLGARVGLRPGTPDGLPIVGPSERLPGLLYATGHYRNGVLLAPLTAALVSDLVVEGRRDPLLDATSPDRFQAIEQAASSSN